MVNSRALESAVIETRYRWVFAVFAAVAALGVLAHFGVLLWASNEFSQAESIVAAQAGMLAHSGRLYFDLRNYPYTVCAYTPIYYAAEAVAIKLGAAGFLAGRLISFAALAGIVILVWRMLMLYTDDSRCASTGALLCASTSVLLSWATVGQVDTLAIFFSIAAFYCYSLFAAGKARTLLWAGLFVVAAWFTKQTMIACPAAIVVALWIENRKTAVKFALCTGGTMLVAALSLNTAMHGRFFENILFANLNPFAWEKVGQHVHYMLIAAGQLMLIVAVGARAASRSHAKRLLIYLGFSFLVLAMTAPKIGSDSHYQMEPTILLIVCACAALHAMDFFRLLASGSKSWITLLQLPLAIHLILNFRITPPFLAARIVKEQLFRVQAARLRRYIDPSERLLSSDMNPIPRAGLRLEVEPLIYKLLVHAGRIDPKPLLEDIDSEKFSAILLYQDVGHLTPTDLEVPSLPDAQMDAVHRHYRLAERVPGPYLEGVYVYLPTHRTGPDPSTPGS